MPAAPAESADPAEPAAPADPGVEVDVLVVGAGPTGLALAIQALAHGATVQVIDRNLDRVHESRALAVQPRTLEILAGAGLAGTLVRRGNPAVQLVLHAGRREVPVPLFDLGMDDTDYPFLLFVSQAVTEQVLADHLAGAGVAVQRAVRLVACHDDGERVIATLQGAGDGTRQVRARYLVGCDGVHSTVRDQAGIGFAGDSYPQTFALADLEVDGLAPGAVHAYLTGTGPLFFFPLGSPATWRMIAMRTTGAGGDPPSETTLDDLQRIVDAAAGTGAAGPDAVRLHDPVWLTTFRLHRRHARRYRAGRIFLAGDAAHVHSPAGAQGMNTGIQDAWNLGWKLALVARGGADPALLDTYQAERAPVGRAVLRFTDRAFRVATATNPLARTVRQRLVPRLAPLVRRARRVRARAFRTVAELTIGYRDSALAQEGHPRLRGGPRAGDRLPGGALSGGGQRRTLHEVTGAPGLHLLLCGPVDRWQAVAADPVPHRYRALVTVHHLSAAATAEGWHDVDGTALARLGLPGPRQMAHYLVRPDGHVGYRAAGTDLAGLHRYLARWLPPDGSAGSGGLLQAADTE